MATIDRPSDLRPTPKAKGRTGRLEMAVAGSALAVGAGAMAVLAFSRRVRYAEQVEIAASADDLYDHLRFQARLMRRSAWPTETGSDCALEGEDGKVGARTVFHTRKGERFGHQELVALEPGRRVASALTSKGPPQKPRLAFELEPTGGGSTRVTLRFDNEIGRPFNVLLRLFGIVRWTRAMHRKDLAGLKRYAEPPYLAYDGSPVRGVSTA